MNVLICANSLSLTKTALNLKIQRNDAFLEEHHDGSGGINDEQVWRRWDTKSREAEKNPKGQKQ